MTAETPGHAAYRDVPAVFSRWSRVNDVSVSDNAILVAWRAGTDAQRAFWTEDAAIAAQQPQPARADEFARVKVRLCALVASLDETVEDCRNTSSEFDLGAAHAAAVDARRIRQILDDTALGVTPQPSPELTEVVAKLAEVAAERDKLLAAPGQRELDGLREKAEAAEQDVAEVRACAVHAFAIIAVLARDNPAAQRQANELRERIGMLPSPPEAEIAELPPGPELIRAMGVIAAYEDYARRMIVPNATARAALRERHGVEPASELAAERDRFWNALFYIAHRAPEYVPHAGPECVDVAREAIGNDPSPAVIHAAAGPQPAPELAAEGTPPDVRPRADGRRGLDITCGKCGEDYGTNVTGLDEIECPECEARRCPNCRTWYGGNDR